jgi:hypothetical protein
MALSASHGYPPQPRCAPYISPSLFKHLVTRARAHAIRSSRPSWRGRTYLCRINRDVIEATVVANDGKATHAVAMRLEHVGGLWRASDLVII